MPEQQTIDPPKKKAKVVDSWGEDVAIAPKQPKVVDDWGEDVMVEKKNVGSNGTNGLPKPTSQLGLLEDRIANPLNFSDQIQPTLSTGNAPNGNDTP